jgi:hypothetical protein
VELEKVELDTIDAIMSKNVENLITGKNSSVSCSTRTLISKQFRNGIFNRFDIIVRYLAIEELYNLNNYGIELYNKMQKKRGTKARYHTIRRFENLINQIQQYGFNSSSRIVIDQDMHLFDGSHRLACALFYKLSDMPVQIKLCTEPVYYSLDWFKINGFMPKELELMENKLLDIFHELDLFFVGTLWPPVSPYFKEISESIAREYNVLLNKEIVFENRFEFEAFVRGVYAIDDIEKWKIDKKIQCFKQYEPIVRLFYFDLMPPNFRAKAANGKAISIEVENIKKKYRTKYSEIIKDYFYDIVIHVGDNYDHTQHIIRLLKKDLNLEAFVESLEGMRYSFIKMETPYMLSSFPKEFPLNKDLDIVCHPDDFVEICNLAENFSVRYLDKYEVVKINEPGRLRLRFELNGFLIYQLDIADHFEKMDKDYFMSALNRRDYINGYYILNKQDEIVVRFIEYRKDPSKIHHQDYIKQNQAYFNTESIRKALSN